MSILLSVFLFFSAPSVECATIQPLHEPDTALFTYIYSTEDERQGCCSRHKGVCGCSNGRALCCDGTLSPTCGCD